MFILLWRKNIKAAGSQIKMFGVMMLELQAKNCCWNIDIKNRLLHY